MKTKSNFSGNQSVLDLKSNNEIKKFTQGRETLYLFNDPMILEAYESKKKSNIKCGQEVLASIDGSKSSIDLTHLSSGQQEILLKIKVIQNISIDTD